MIRSLCILASLLMLVQPGFGQDGRAQRAAFLCKRIAPNATLSAVSARAH